MRNIEIIHTGQQKHFYLIVIDISLFSEFTQIEADPFLMGKLLTYASYLQAQQSKLHLLTGKHIINIQIKFYVAYKQILIES